MPATAWLSSRRNGLELRDRQQFRNAPSDVFQCQLVHPKFCTLTRVAGLSFTVAIVALIENPPCG